jgi:hypothetical protein
MEFPVTGLIILVAAIWFFFFRPRWLYAAMIVSIPFSATVVVNFPMAGSDYGVGASPVKSIMAFQLFTILWIAREAISRLPQWRRRGWFLTRRARFGLLAFLGAVALSLCVPLVFNGTSSVLSFEAVHGDFFVATIPLRFTFYNLTQFAYLVFGITLSIFVAAENWHPARLLSTLKLYASSCVFAAAWGIYELWCNVTGHAYAAQIFNTSKNLSAMGYNEAFEMGSLIVGRISSVAMEPSDLAEELLFAFVVLLVCLGLRRGILRRGWNWVAVVLIGIVLLMSTSSTAYFGILAAMTLSGVALARAGSHRWKHYIAFPVVILALVELLTAWVPLVDKIVQTAIFLKYVNGSGHTRLESVQNAARAFAHYPILGSGWPAVQSNDLLFLILANTGLIGLITFASFLLPVLRGLWRLVSRRNFLATVILPAIAVALILAEGKGLTYGPGYFWLFLGLASGAAVAAKMEVPATLADHDEEKSKRRPRTGVVGIDCEDPFHGLGPQGVTSG